jgi:phosphoglycerate dehydrogenase-like enzyme
VGNKQILVWLHAGEQALCEALARLDGVSVLRAASHSQALAAMHETDGLVTSTVLWDRDFARELARASRLIWIQVLNAGFDNMERLGVPERVIVSTIGDIGAATVAEHALALLLALLHGLPAALNAQRNRVWDPRNLVRSARTLHDLEVGVLGFGHIGRAAAARARAFGARVVAFARTARIEEGGIEVRALADFRASLPQLDAVLICAPLNDATEGLLDAAALAVMKPGARLVNVSRGAIVETIALVDALKKGKLGGAALDVVEPEPLPASNPLWTLPNVIITPHVAWAGGGDSHFLKQCELVIENVGRFARGEGVLNAAAMRHMASE